MPRPALRPMRALPLLEVRRGALETCVFCPKLCRSACPVSNADTRETVTPWGKMTSAWMVAHGDVPLDASHAAPPWACTGCFACREACDHRNTVGEVLFDARDALRRSGFGPQGASRALAAFQHHDARTSAAARRLMRRQLDPDPDPGRDLRPAPRRGQPRTALLVGCTYLRGAPREASDALDVATALVGAGVEVVASCCGLPLRYAGDRPGFLAHARSVAAALGAHERVLVVDPGCAVALKKHYPDAGVNVETRIDLLVEEAARAAEHLLRPDPRGAPEPVRWHDPCQLGRGLGIYDAPRAILSRALGRAPAEFASAREQGLCSGAGGLLPSTMPDVAASIANAALEAHDAAGGGRLVTACASSLLALRRAARRRPTPVPVDDLVSWMARSLRTRPAA